VPPGLIVISANVRVDAGLVEETPYSAAIFDCEIVKDRVAGLVYTEGLPETQVPGPVEVTRSTVPVLLVEVIGPPVLPVPGPIIGFGPTTTPDIF